MYLAKQNCKHTLNKSFWARTARMAWMAFPQLTLYVGGCLVVYSFSGVVLDSWSCPRTWKRPGKEPVLRLPNRTWGLLEENGNLSHPGAASLILAKVDNKQQGRIRKDQRPSFVIDDHSRKAPILRQLSSFFRGVRTTLKGKLNANLGNLWFGKMRFWKSSFGKSSWSQFKIKNPEKQVYRKKKLSIRECKLLKFVLKILLMRKIFKVTSLWAYARTSSSFSLR